MNLGPIYHCIDSDQIQNKSVPGNCLKFKVSLSKSIELPVLSWSRGNDPRFADIQHIRWMCITSTCHVKNVLFNIYALFITPTVRSIIRSIIKVPSTPHEGKIQHYNICLKNAQTFVRGLDWESLSRMASETERLAILREEIFDPSRITYLFGEKRYYPPPTRDETLRIFPVSGNGSDCGNFVFGCHNEEV